MYHMYHTHHIMYHMFHTCTICTIHVPYVLVYLDFTCHAMTCQTDNMEQHFNKCCFNNNVWNVVTNNDVGAVPQILYMSRTTLNPLAMELQVCVHAGVKSTTQVKSTTHPSVVLL